MYSQTMSLKDMKSFDWVEDFFESDGVKKFAERGDAVYHLLKAYGETSMPCNAGESGLTISIIEELTPTKSDWKCFNKDIKEKSFSQYRIGSGRIELFFMFDQRDDNSFLLIEGSFDIAP